MNSLTSLRVHGLRLSSLIVAMTILAASAFLPDARRAEAAAPPSPNWLAEAQRGIAQREYNVTWQSRTNGESGWQAPNRTQNMRTYFSPDTVTVVPRDARTAGAQWETGLRLTGFGREGTMNAVAGLAGIRGEARAEGNRIEFEKGGIVESYLNDVKGLKQDFVIERAPGSGDGKLILEIEITGSLEPRLSPDRSALEFLSPGQAGAVLRYTGLRVFDACGDALPANLDLLPATEGIPWTLRIEVADSGAQYPVTVDPLLTGAADTVLAANQAGAGLGNSVAGVGDVNGDGYDDVMVGASLYDDGQVDEGAAFLFLGSASGVESAIPSGSAGTLEGQQVGASMGSSVAGAGDVNGDGYADVIVGASNYDQTLTDEGAFFVILGGPTGLQPDSLTGVTSGHTNAYLGSSVAGAGDVNGDGYDDVIVGGSGYTSSFTSEGAVFIFLGSDLGIVGGDLSSAATTILGNQASAQAGYSVAGAGDVNGDGYADVIIGAFGYDNGQTDEGAAFVFNGSSTGIVGGFLTDANASLEANQASTRFGWSVAGAGDVDGDGYSDVIVGARLYDDGLTDQGAAFIFKGSAAGITSGTPGIANTVLEGNQAGAYFGYSVAAAGDVNGDGYADVIVGADGVDYIQLDEGAAYIFLGSANGIADGDPTFAFATIRSSQASAYMGVSVAGAGDVNGDGFADVIVGDANYDNSFTDEGVAFIYLGGSTGVTSDGAPPTADASFESYQTGSQFGSSVAGAGDVNGDGYSDVIVGAPNYDNGQIDEGAAFIFAGSANGIPPGNPVNAATVIDSNQANAQLGNSVAGAGDVNGDGYGDVIIGARYYTKGQTNEGAAFVFLGSPAGIPSGNPLSAATVLESNQAASNFGFSVDGAGDVNGDGYSDVIVGAPNYDGSVSEEGAAFVFMGTAAGVLDGNLSNAAAVLASQQSGGSMGWSVAGAGDVNGDGYADVIVGAYIYDDGESQEGAAFVFQGSAGGIASGTPATAAATLQSNQANSWFGWSVDGAGDVNGDGYADVVVGAMLYSQGRSNEGGAFIFNGGPSGVASGNPTTAATTIAGGRSGSVLGKSVAGAGDVNGDGYADVIFGAPEYFSVGEAYLYLGGPTGIPNGVASGAFANFSGRINANQSNAFLGLSVAAAGDINGDGYSDVIVGAPFYDGGQTDEGAAFVFYGNKGVPSASTGRTVHPRQLRALEDVPISIGLNSDSGDSFRLAAIARHPAGRGKVKLEWEVKPLGTPFDGTGTVQSVFWTDTGLTGADLTEVAGGLTAGTNYHWRVRILYRLGIAPFITHSRWIAQAPDGWNLTDVRTGASIEPTPTETPTPTPFDGRPFGDFDNSGCTDLNDFLFLLDYWLLVSPAGGEAIGLNDFLALLDYWQSGPGCA